MIAGIGIDLVECGRFLDWSAFKKQRIFTKKELEMLLNDGVYHGKRFFREDTMELLRTCTTSELNGIIP